MRNFKPFTELFDILETMNAFNNWTDLSAQLNLIVEDKRGAYLLFKNLMANSEPSNDNSRATAVEKLLYSRILTILEYWEVGASAPADIFSPLWHRGEITNWAIGSSSSEDPKIASNKIEFKGLDICLEVK